ncbi:MAG: hypothetical protein WDO17_13680 [Alphaproteobacteria bacterium]
MQGEVKQIDQKTLVLEHHWLTAWVREFLIERYQKEGEGAFERFKKEEIETLTRRQMLGPDGKATGPDQLHQKVNEETWDIVKPLIDHVIQQARAHMEAAKKKA